jgi:hypothetical protein
MAIEKFVIQVCGWLIGIPLEILVIVALLRGGYRRYPIVFLYVIVNFVTTLVDIPISTQSLLTHDLAVLRQAARVYWVNEWILQALIFATVLSLIDLAISTSRWRRLMRAGLAAGALLFAGTSFLIHYLPPPVKYGIWMTPWTRDLSVCATILDLALWMILIASRKSDRRILLISGALGMQFTGEAIGEAIVSLSMPHMVEALALTGSVVAVAANLACLYVWWQTFRLPFDREASLGCK